MIPTSHMMYSSLDMLSFQWIYLSTEQLLLEKGEKKTFSQTEINLGEIQLLQKMCIKALQLLEKEHLFTGDSKCCKEINL